MANSHIEAGYPLSFRKEEARALGEHLKFRHNVELVGAKRVGISNFLRFFLYNKQVASTYIKDGKKHLFVPVDLNHLFERDLFPFWVLTFKRLVDSVGASTVIDKTVKKEVSVMFLESIQSRDMFLTIETFRKALSRVVDEDILPTFFFLRFDRLGPALNGEFFSNLVGLQDENSHKVCYVFTSVRALDEIAPGVFDRKNHSTFSHPLYVKTANENDSKIIFETLKDKYHVDPADDLEEELMKICGGHVQYLQLSLIVVNQKGKTEKVTVKNALDVLKADERINLQSEEIWESLKKEEQRVLLAVCTDEEVKKKDRNVSTYLWETGILNKEDNVFSPLLSAFLTGLKEKGGIEEKVDLTKKEKQLYDFLLKNKGEICERERIIEAVWPEVSDLGVSDWTIDRLVARVRAKLKTQKSKYEIVTVKTRGFKLT